MNIQDSSTSSTSDLSTTDFVTIATTTEESSSTLLHRLHTNERQLRTLAVILSLTGGLSLSFALGVGIMIYWYSRKCKQRRKLHMKGVESDGYGEEDDDDDDEKSCTTTNYSYCASCDMMVQDQQLEMASEIRNTSDTYRDTLIQSSIATIPPPVPLITTAATSIISSSTSPPPSSSSASSAHHFETIDLANLPPPPTSHLPTPEPSAPSAKELHHLHSSSSRSNQPHQHQQQQGQAAEDEEEELCHDCLVPPPAYTKEL